MVRLEEQSAELKANLTSASSLTNHESKSLRSYIPEFIAAVITGSLHIILGMSFAYSAILIPQLKESQNATNATSIILTDAQSSWITSCITLVVPLSSLFCGAMMDSIGRLAMLKLSAIPNVLGWVLFAFAYNLPMIIAARILTGIGMTLASNPAVVYVTEIGRPDLRGSLLAIMPVFFSVGLILIYLQGWLMSWRVVAWLNNLYAIVPVILIMCFLHESPVWLVSKGRIAEARKSLQWFNSYQPQPTFTTESLAELKLAQIQKDHQKKLKEHTQTNGNNVLKQIKLFALPTGWKPFLILTGVFFFQQFSGIYVILFNAVIFVRDLGTSVDPYLVSIIVSVMRLVMGMVGGWLMKLYTRRRLIITSALGMMVTMFFSGLFTQWIHNNTTTYTWVPIVMLILYFMFTAIGMMSIPFIIIAELFPLAIRGLSHSMIISITNLLMFVALQGFLTLKYYLGGSAGVQYFFAIMSASAAVFCFVFLPETHKKTLNEIEEYFWHHSTYLSVRSQRKREAQHVDEEMQDVAENFITK